MYTYPRVDEGKSVENHQAQHKKGKWVVPANPTELSSLRHFEQMFELVGLGHGSGTVVRSWFRYGAALRNLASTTMRTTRQSLREVLATLLAPLTGGVIVGRTLS